MSPGASALQRTGQSPVRALVSNYYFFFAGFLAAAFLGVLQAIFALLSENSAFSVA